MHVTNKTSLEPEAVCPSCSRLMGKIAPDKCVTIGEKTFCPACTKEALHKNVFLAQKAKRQAGLALFLVCALMALGGVAAFSVYTTGGRGAGLNAALAAALFFGLARLAAVWMETRFVRKRREAGENAGAPFPQTEKLPISLFCGVVLAPLTAIQLFAVVRHAGEEARNSQTLLREHGGKSP